MVACVIALAIATLLRERWRKWRDQRRVPIELRAGWRGPDMKAWYRVGLITDSAEAAIPPARLVRGFEWMPRRALPPPIPAPEVAAPIERFVVIDTEHAAPLEHGPTTTTPARPYVRPPPTRMPGPLERCSR